MPRPIFTPGKEPVPIVQEAGWAPAPVWTGAENLATGTGTSYKENSNKNNGNTVKFVSEFLW